MASQLLQPRHLNRATLPVGQLRSSLVAMVVPFRPRHCHPQISQHAMHWCAAEPKTNLKHSHVNSSTYGNISVCKCSFHSTHTVPTHPVHKSEQMSRQTLRIPMSPTNPHTATADYAPELHGHATSPTVLHFAPRRMAAWHHAAAPHIGAPPQAASALHNML